MEFFLKRMIYIVLDQDFVIDSKSFYLFFIFYFILFDDEGKCFIFRVNIVVVEKVQ